LLGSVDDTLSDHIALHNASENVNEDGFDLRVPLQNLESFANLPVPCMSAKRAARCNNSDEQAVK
jgi:hypothetical protein